MIVTDVSDLIGNTPLLKLECGIPNVSVYAKMEMLNPFGSVKDRIAWNMIKDDVDRIVSEQKIIIESSSGNTAKGLAVFAKKLGVPLEIITNRVKLSEVRDTLAILGARVTELPGSSECPDPSNPADPIAQINSLVESNPGMYFHTDQYCNPKNVAAHYKTGCEIHSDLPEVGFFFADLGTCGTSRGIGSALRDLQSSPPVVCGVVTAQGGYVPGGRNENELFESGLFDKSFYDEILPASTEDAISGMLELHSHGVLCGPTSGLVFAALKQYFASHPQQSPVSCVFVVCDRLEPYLSLVKKYVRQFESSSDLDVSEVSDIEIISDPFGYFVVDIRTAFAYGLGHIEGSLNLPMSVLDDMLLSQVFLPAKKIAVACPTGVLSRKYAALLVRQGYDAVSLSLEQFKIAGGSLTCICN